MRARPAKPAGSVLLARRPVTSKSKPTPRQSAPAGGRTVIAGPLLDRLIREKMARTRECDGLAAMPVVRVPDGATGCNWRVPGYVGDLAGIPRCEAALRHYLDFLATQFDLADD